MRILFALLTIGVSLGVGAFAEEAADPFAPVVTDLVVVPDIVLENKIGAPVLLKFKDGREAVLKIRRHQIYDLKMPLNITENTCADLQTLKCDYSINVQFNWLVFIWTKNPDMNKIGKAVYYQPEGTSAKIVSAENSIFSDVVDTPIQTLAPTLPHSSLTCPRYDWLPENGKDAPEKIDIAIWTQELMVPNRDTGMSENRTVTTANNVIFNKNKSEILVLQNVGGRGGSTNISELVLGDVLAWWIQKSDGELCQVAIKPGGFNQALSIYNRETQAVRSHPELVNETFIAKEYSELTFEDDPAIEELQRLTQNPVEYFK
jgi:hypothetical protein